MEKLKISETEFGYKCGEIYINNCVYTYKCCFCSYNHKNITTLKKHLSQHKNILENNSTNQYSSNESIFNEENKFIIESEAIESYSDLELNSINAKIKIDVVSNHEEFEIDDDFKSFTLENYEKFYQLNTNESERSSSPLQEFNKSSSEWIKCEFCRCRMYKYSLPNHIKTFHSEHEKVTANIVNEEKIFDEYVCRFCSTCFTSIENVMEHEQKCNSLDWTKCKDCGIYVFKNKLLLHMEEKHNFTKKLISNEDSLCCKICNQNFLSRTITLQHEKTCTSRDEKISCHFCGCYIFKHHLKDHLTKEHIEHLNNLEDNYSDYEKNSLEDETIDDNNIEEIYENELLEDNSTNKVKDLKIEILFDSNTENLENCISLSPTENFKVDHQPITRWQAKNLILKYNSLSNKSRNRRKLCTKCNRVSNDIYRHRKICSLKREWVTCIYCGCHMFKERLERHINIKHSHKINLIKNEYEYNDDDDDEVVKNIYNNYFNNDADNDNNSNENTYNNKTKSCQYCGRFIVNLLQHELNCVQSKTRVTCKICGKHIFKRNIYKHMDLHNHLNKSLLQTSKNNDKCRYCNRNFNTRWGSLERHEKYCLNLINREKCKYCKYFISKINMEKHIFNKHMDKDGNIKNILSTNYENFSENDHNKLPCRYCNKLYLQPVLHEKHCSSRTGYEKEWTRCQICAALVQRLRLSIHMKKIHKIVTDDKGNDIENEHITDDIKAEFVKCILCGCHILLKNFQYHIFRIHKDRLPLKEHEILDYNKLSTIDLTQFRTSTIFPEWIKCKECGLMVAEPTLESHLEIHKKFGNLRGTNFKCNICNKKYPARRYEQHIRTAHLDENNSVFCNECDLKRIHNDYYEDHMKWHRGEINGYQCKICNRRYELKYNLDRHMKTHEEKESCDCPECGKTFPNKLRLNQHIQIHSTDAKYQCDTCGKAFIIKSRLQSHQLTHMDKKFYRFPCTICNKRFSGKAKLADHMITHTRTKNFKCEICDAKFARKFDAIKHQRRHTEIGHLMCSMCEKRFFLKRPLKDHLKSQHGILDENAIIDTRIQQDSKDDDDSTFFVTEIDMEQQHKVISETVDYEIVMELDV